MRTWMRRALFALGVPLGLALLLVVGAWGYLTSNTGEKAVRAWTLAAAGEAISGTLGAERLELGPGRLVLQGLTLRDPEGELVAALGRVEARFSPRALLDRVLVLDDLRLEEPRLHLRTDERGLNLSRALAARQPATPRSGPARPLLLVVRLEGLLIEGGQVSYRGGAEMPHEVELVSLSGTGSGAHDGRRASSSASLRLTGQVEKPLVGPLSLAVEGSLEEGHGRAKLRLSAPGLKLEAAGRTEGAAERRIELSMLEVSPEAARTVLPGYPLKLPVLASGELSRQADVGRARFSLRAGAAEASVNGSADLTQLRTEGLDVTVRGVNLEELLGSGPRSSLSLDLHARGGGTHLDDVDADVALTVPQSRVGSEVIGPLRLVGHARGGQLRIDELTAVLPGLRIAGAGGITRQTIDISGKLTAADLRRVSHALGRLGELALPMLSGKGALDFELRGPTSRPGLRLRGGFSQLAYRAYSVEKLAFSASIPDTSRPLQAQAALEASAIKLEQRSFKQLSAKLVTRGRQLEADLSTSGLTDVVLHLGGTIDRGHRGLALEALALRYPEAEWRLQKPTHLTFGADRFALEPLVLEAGDQSLALDVRYERGRATGTLGMTSSFTRMDSSFDVPVMALLERRPEPLRLSLDVQPFELRDALAAVGRAEPLSGKVGAQLTVSGNAREPLVRAVMTGQGARYAGKPLRTTDFELVVESGPQGKLEGRLDLESSGSTGRVALRTPYALAQLLARPPTREELERAPLDLDVDLRDVDARLLQELGLDLDAKLPGSPPDARVSAHLTGAGTLAAPRLRLEVRVDDLRVGPAFAGSGSIQYTYEKARNTVRASLASRGGGTLTVEGNANLDLSLPALRRGSRPQEAPLEARVKASGFDLALATGLLPDVRAISGPLAADVRVEGTFEAPRLRGEAEWRDGGLSLLGYGEYKQVHVKLGVAGDRLELADLSAHAGGGTLRLAGTGVLAGGSLNIKAQGELERFPIFDDDQIVAVVTTRPSLEGVLTGRLVDIRNLDVRRAQIDLPEVRRKDLQELSRPDDIVLVKNGQPVSQLKRGRAELTQDSPRPRRYRVQVHAPQNVWVRATDVNAEVGLSDGFHVEREGRTTVFGEIRAIRGRVSLLGREFEVQRGSQLRFLGPWRQPQISLTATHTIKREGVAVHIALLGQGKELSLETTSEPALPESEIYTLLATGRRTLKPSSGASLSTRDAASMAGAFLTAQLKKTLAAKLPLDVFSIEAGEDGLDGARLEAGKYVTDEVYVGYSGRLGANPAKENTHSARLELQLSPRWSLEAEYGDARVGGMDLIWSRDY